MTSKDKAVVSLPVSPWDAILKAAKDQLPSLDSDSSLSDCEDEEPFIFQRNQPVLIPDLSEELAEDPIGVDESGTWVTAGRSPSPEPLLVPGRLAIEPRSDQMVRSTDLACQERRDPGWACQSCVKSSPILVDAEEAPAWLEDSLRSLSKPRGSQSPPWCSQEEEATFPLEGELKTEPSDTDFRNSTKRRALRRERRKMIERDILQKVTQSAQSPACGDQGQTAELGPEATSELSREGWPVLSLKVGVLTAQPALKSVPTTWAHSCHTVEAGSSSSGPKAQSPSPPAAPGTVWDRLAWSLPQGELVAIAFFREHRNDPAAVKAGAPAGLPAALESMLSFQQLEGWDLDYILQSLPGQQDSQGDSASRSAWWLADRCQDQGHSTGPSQDILLEQLALLCATQSRVSNPTWKVSADKLQDTEEQVARIRSASAEPGFPPEQIQKLAESRRLKTEPSTVFIDLRQTEPSELQDHQSQESSEHSSSDSEEEVESAGSVQVASSWEQRYCTGKSHLLQQLRVFRKGAVPPQPSASDSPGGQKAQASEDTAGSQTRRKKQIKPWSEKQNLDPDLGDPTGPQLLPGMGQL